MLATYVDVRLPFNSYANLPKVQTVTLHRRAFQHEMLQITTRNTTGNQAKLRTGDPVQALLRGQGDNPTNFYGYVENCREDKSIDGGDQSYRRFQVLCVGATWPMKAQKSRSWTNTTVAAVAKQIIGEYNLTADVEDSNIVLPYIAQTNESDWAFLCRIAKQFGYVVYPEGVTVHFNTWDRFAQHKRSTARILRFRDRMSGRRGQIRKFKPVISETSPQPEGQRGQRTIQGVDPRTGAPWSFQHDGFPNQPTRVAASEAVFATRAVIAADSAQEAQARLEGSQEALRWQHRAKAEVDGYSDTFPSSMVYLDGLQSEYDGYWTVLGCSLHWDTLSSDFRMDVELGTDAVGASVVGAPDPRRPMDTSYLTGRSTRIPNAYLNLPAGSPDTTTLQGRGGPLTVTWRSDTQDTSPPDSSPRLPAWVVARWRSRGGN